MTEEDIIKATDDHLKVLKENKRIKLIGGHNRSITEFHDAMANLRSIEDQVCYPFLKFSATVD